MSNKDSFIYDTIKNAIEAADVAIIVIDAVGSAADLTKNKSYRCVIENAPENGREFPLKESHGNVKSFSSSIESHLMIGKRTPRDADKSGIIRAELGDLDEALTLKFMSLGQTFQDFTTASGNYRIMIKSIGVTGTPYVPSLTDVNNFIFVFSLNVDYTWQKIN